MNVLKNFCLFSFILLLPGLFFPAVTPAQDTTRTDTTMLNKIKQEMEDEKSSRSDNISRRVQGTRSASATSNPDISVIGDFQSLYTSGGDRNWDAYLNGMELNFSSAIDPYARADFYPVFEGEEGELHAHLEEAYITTLSLPFNLQLKAGKFRQSFGRMNLTHRHALPVIDVPVAYESFMGEAMIDQGFSLSWLIPNPRFYQELIVEVTRGPEESPVFALSDFNNPVTLAHLKNFWTLTENSTLELGLSGAFGDNEFGGTSKLGGIDLTYIWKPVRYNIYRSFEWQTEFFFSEMERPDLGISGPVDSWGIYSWVQYQLSQRWFLTGMYSYGENPSLGNAGEQAVSATLGWYATEFQKLEIGPRLATENSFNDALFSGLFRWVFVIGTHGAHQY